MAAFSTNPELLAAVRAWASVNYPGCPLDFIAVHLRYLPVPIQLAEGPILQASAPPPREQEGDGERGVPLPRCLTDILATLREVGRPLTTTRLMEEMWKKGREWSERSLNRYLTALMDDGTIENPEGVRPRGYRLAENDSSEGTP